MLYLLEVNVYKQLDKDMVEKNGVVYNYSSLSEEYENLKILPSFNITKDISEINQYEFDLFYMNYLENNNYAFYIYFSKIIMNLMSAIDVYLLISDNEYMSLCNESLTKFIQVRYGYIASYINTPEDINIYRNQYSNFSIAGIFNYSEDEKRYLSMIYTMP